MTQTTLLTCLSFLVVIPFQPSGNLTAQEERPPREKDRREVQRKVEREFDIKSHHDVELDSIKKMLSNHGIDMEGDNIDVEISGDRDGKKIISITITEETDRGPVEKHYRIVTTTDADGVRKDHRSGERDDRDRNAPERNRQNNSRLQERRERHKMRRERTEPSRREEKHDRADGVRRDRMREDHRERQSDWEREDRRIREGERERQGHRVREDEQDTREHDRGRTENLEFDRFRNFNREREYPAANDWARDRDRKWDEGNRQSMYEIHRHFEHLERRLNSIDKKLERLIEHVDRNERDGRR